jgi:dimethylargininase
MYIALTRAVPVSINRCELSHVAREPIDYSRAVAQHTAYETALEQQGCRVEHLPDTPDLPDSVFVEDAAVVFDALAVIARSGAPSRRLEVESVAEALKPHRPLAFIEAPGTLDGGDVLVTPGRVFVGLSARTNAEGVRQLTLLLAPHGLSVTGVPVTNCLHLKSAVTLAADDTLLVNPEWVDLNSFTGRRIVSVDPLEPYAANVLRIGNRTLVAAEHPRTRDRLESLGVVTVTLAAEELGKAEGGLTCCSLLMRT